MNWDWQDIEGGSLLIDEGCVIGYITNGSWKSEGEEDIDKLKEKLGLMTMNELMGLMFRGMDRKWTLREGKYKGRILGIRTPYEDFKGLDNPPEERLVALDLDDTRPQYFDTAYKAKQAVEHTLNMTTYDTVKAYTKYMNAQKVKDKMNKDIEDMLGGNEND